MRWFRSMKWLWVVLIIFLVLAATSSIWVPRAIGSLVLFQSRNEKYLDRIAESKMLQQGSLPGVVYYQNNVALQVPWTNEKEIRRGADWLVVSFTGGQTIFIMKEFPPRDYPLGTYPEVLSFFNQIKTNFDLVNLVVATTPADIRFIDPPSKSIPKSVLLILKSVLIPYREHPIYAFTNKNGVRGFEYSPSATSTAATFFLPNDEMYFIEIRNAPSQETEHILQSLSAQ